MPELKELYTALKDKGFVIVGVHTKEDSQKMAGFVKDKQIDWPVVVDDGSKSSKAFGVRGYPTTVLIDTTGKIVEIYLGAHPDKETIEKLLPKDGKKEEKKDDSKKDDDKKSDDKKDK